MEYQFSSHIYYLFGVAFIDRFTCKQRYWSFRMWGHVYTNKRSTIRKERGHFTMTTSKESLRICSNGHEYYKSSDCPSCPICEQERKPTSGFLSKLSAPARRALEHNGITTVKQLATFSEKEILQFHGIGPASLPILRASLEDSGLSFKIN